MYIIYFSTKLISRSARKRTFSKQIAYTFVTRASLPAKYSNLQDIKSIASKFS